jgi:hypothetical protein
MSELLACTRIPERSVCEVVPLQPSFAPCSATLVSSLQHSRPFNYALLLVSMGSAGAVDANDS